MQTARWMLLAVLVAPAPALALEEPKCLSQSEVTGGYKRYHIVNGQQCWYAAGGPEARPSPDKPAPEAQSANAEADPYGDPIWRQGETRRGPAKPRQSKPAPAGGPLILNPSSAYSR